MLTKFESFCFWVSLSLQQCLADGIQSTHQLGLLLLSWVYRFEQGILRFFVQVALGAGIGHNLFLAGLGHLPLISLLLVHVDQPGYALRE